MFDPLVVLDGLKKSEHNIGQIEVSTLFYLCDNFHNHRYISKN